MNLFMSAVLPGTFDNGDCLFAGECQLFHHFYQTVQPSGYSKDGKRNAGTTNVLRSVGAKAAA